MGVHAHVGRIHRAGKRHCADRFVSTWIGIDLSDVSAMIDRVTVVVIDESSRADAICIGVFELSGVVDEEVPGLELSAVGAWEIGLELLAIDDCAFVPEVSAADLSTGFAISVGLLVHLPIVTG